MYKERQNNRTKQTSITPDEDVGLIDQKKTTTTTTTNTWEAIKKLINEEKLQIDYKQNRKQEVSKDLKQESKQIQRDMWQTMTQLKHAAIPFITIIFYIYCTKVQWKTKQNKNLIWDIISEKCLIVFYYLTVFWFFSECKD